MNPKNWPIRRHIAADPEIAALCEMIDHFHTEPGHLTPAERNAICDQATVLAGGTRSDVGNVPDYLERIVKKSALYAYRVLDKDYDKVRDAGHDENKIFEATLGAIMGSNLARLEIGLDALDELNSERSSEMGTDEKGAKHNVD